ncbi:DUF2865 domain-containing protein [Mesorhizobium sp. SP-1A]|uniref:DUF2865 domain-containing protein n=1 Tax=Mesorhizobium sp. SP-1A TaxID=3077840 RepID=UPI0028F70C98|nr:DUF2865 domain-containing protein [Mesorhizobium sp. SP-1A]
MRGGTRRLALATATIFGAAVASVFAPAATQAASPACRQLEAELAATKGSSGRAVVGRYDAAIARQNDELAKARAQSRAAGCGFSLFGGNISHCAELNAALERMNRNLDMLERKRARLAAGASPRDRARIQARLEANGCNDTAAPRIVKAETQTEVRILGGSAQTADPDGMPPQPNDTAGESVSGRVLNLSALPSGGGDYRTLCVRTCDGYFFPMSTAASTGEFERDQKNCESSCPGTEIQLFYTRGFDNDPAGMISTATGRPYDQLSSAYLYKRPNASIPRGCGCNAAKDFKIIAGNPAAGAAGGSSFLPVPATRPDPAADSETLANAAGGLDAEALRELAAKPADSPKSTAEDRRIRVVGPTFLPDPEGAIDLQVPAPKTGR